MTRQSPPSIEGQCCKSGGRATKVEDRLTELRRLGIGKELAAQTAGSRKRYWHISRSPALSMALTRAHLIQLGLPLLLEPEPNV